jgi:hypothetical protein
MANASEESQGKANLCLITNEDGNIVHEVKRTR